MVHLRKHWSSYVTVLSIALGVVGLLVSGTSSNQQEILTGQTQLSERLEQVNKAYHDDLLERFPLGYVLFGIDAQDRDVIPHGNATLQDYEVDWGKAKVIRDDGGTITLQTPDLRAKSSDVIMTGNIIGLPKNKGHFINYYRHSDDHKNWVILTAGVLDVSYQGIVSVIGLSESLVDDSD